jgi:hypothetical protein
MQYDIIGVISFALTVSVPVTNIHQGHQGLQTCKEHKICIFCTGVQLSIPVNVKVQQIRNELSMLV